MDTIPVPTLSIQGWVTDKANKMDFLLSHFFLADFNQTQLYVGSVASITRIIQENGNKADFVIPNLKQTLQTYFSNYYTNVDVNVVSNPDINNSATNEFELKITIAITDSDGSASYERLIKLKDSKFLEIVKLNNYG